MHGNNIAKISKTVIKHFTKNIVISNKLSGFAKRKSKLGAKLFIETLVSGYMLDPQISLEGLSSLMKERGISISKQGIHQRFKDEAIRLLQFFF